MFTVAGENSTEQLKRQHQALKTESVKLRMESIDSTLLSDLLRSVNQSRDKGGRSWLTALSLVVQGLVLNRQEFRGCLSDLLSKCVCGEKPSAMPCQAKREGSWRRDRIVFAYLPRLLVRFAPTLKSNHNYNLSIMSDSTSEARKQAWKQGWT